MLAVKPEETGLDKIVRSSQLSKRFQGQARQLAKTVLDSVATLLDFKDLDVAKAEADLALCASRFFSAAVGLSSQLPFTFCNFLDRLQKEEFNVPHELMEPHQVLNLKALEDEDETGELRTPEEAEVHGANPDLIIQPLVSRTGDELGQCWDSQRHISKALIWVCTPECRRHMYALLPDVAKGVHAQKDAPLQVRAQIFATFNEVRPKLAQRPPLPLEGKPAAAEGKTCASQQSISLKIPARNQEKPSDDKPIQSTKDPPQTTKKKTTAQSQKRSSPDSPSESSKKKLRIMGEASGDVAAAGRASTGRTSPRKAKRTPTVKIEVDP